MKKSIFSLIVLFFGVINSEDQFVEPIVGISWFEMVGYLVYTILWTINRNHHRNIQILIHKIIYAILIIQVFLSALNSICYTLMIKYPKSDVLRYVTPTISLLMNFSILLLSILLVSGLSVVFDSLNMCQCAITVFSTTFFAIALYVLECITKVQYNFVVFIIFLLLFIFGYVFYFISIMYLSKIATHALVIHLDMIAQRGINPNTTPSYKKISMLRFTRNSSVALFFILVVCYILFFAEFAPYWVIYGIKTIAMLILVGIICYKCRIRQAMSSTYGDDEEAYIVNDDNVNPVNNVIDINPQMAQDLASKFQKQTKETQDLTKNNIINISRDTGMDNNNEDDNEGHNLNDIGDNENKTNGDGDINKTSEKKNWSPDVILPSIPQIHNLSHKIYSKDPDE